MEQAKEFVSSRDPPRENSSIQKTVVELVGCLVVVGHQEKAWLVDHIEYHRVYTNTQWIHSFPVDRLKREDKGQMEHLYEQNRM